LLQSARVLRIIAGPYHVYELRVGEAGRVAATIRSDVPRNECPEVLSTIQVTLLVDLLWLAEESLGGSEPGGNEVEEM
jgi:hypothetical protein